MDRVISSTVSMCESVKLETTVIFGACLIAAVLSIELPIDALPSWSRRTDLGHAAYSMDGWWQRAVSVPILSMMVLGWLWRLALWTRLLFLISRLRSNLVSSHPDKCGGLKFMGLSLQACSIVIFGFASIMAGTVANRVMHDVIALGDFHFVIGGFAAFALFCRASACFLHEAANRA